ncbi:MAG: enoyl-CoA hydratase/isomerase family protein [Acidimicrobiales bacterium]
MSTVELSSPRAGVALVTLNRPERLNAMSHELVAELHATLDEVGRDRGTRVIVLTGAGRGFCAGLDLKDAGRPPGVDGLGRVEAGMVGQQHIAALVPRLRSLRQPVIAAVNGAAAGGGLALALACDVRLAAPEARFNVAFVRIGLSGCDIGVSWLLPRLIGASRAFELMLTGRIVDAAEADRLGIVSRVVEGRPAVDAALDVADEILANSPTGVWMTKEVMWSQLEVGSLQAGIDLENRTQIMTSMTDDIREAISAFVEKRSPHFGPT